jgi:predicted acyltransferase
MPPAAIPATSSPISGATPAPAPPPIAQPSVTAGAPPRVLSVDVLRGLTIALMILVNDPGDWAHTYTQLDHAKWNGFTLTDFVFPNFLFLVGVSIVFSLQSRIARSASGILDKATKKTLALHILRRAFLIFAIKMFLTAFPYFHYTHFRIYGVLTRIALCYLVAGLICLVVWNAKQRARTLIAVTASLLVGYWALMRFVPLPGLGTPTHDFPILDPDRNLTAWLDRAISSFTQSTIHTGTLYEHTRDPEGLLSTLPAIATTLVGSLTGLWLRRATIKAPVNPSPTSNGRHSERSEEPPYFARSAPAITPARCLTSLLLTGIASLTAGLLWNFSFPINKNLWTSSFVLYAAGWSLLTLALCYWLIDIRRLNNTSGGKALLWPWLVFGSNAITAFVVSNLIVKIMLWIKVSDSFSTTGKPVTAWLWTYRHLFARNGSTEVTSLIFAMAVVAACFLPNWLLWRKKIFLKV